jgi:hypothetical protein
MASSNESVLAVETSCRRVTAEDLQSVTPADVERVRLNMTPEQYRAALRIMAEHNKTQMVLANVPQPSVSAALAVVSGDMFRDARARTQSSPTMQAMLLAQTTERIRRDSVDAIERMQAAGDLF